MREPLGHLGGAGGWSDRVALAGEEQGGDVRVDEIARARRQGRMRPDIADGKLLTDPVVAVEGPPGEGRDRLGIDP